MADLQNFTLKDMTEFGAALRSLGEEAETMQEVADRVVRYLFDHLRDPSTGQGECVLVRFFKTHPFQELPPDLQQFATDVLGGCPKPPNIRCLTLLATAGIEVNWNRPELSLGHRAIPLPSPEAVQRFPMIGHMFQQFGVQFEEELDPSSQLLLESKPNLYNVFHVQEARGSTYVPAQEEFVIPYGVASAFGIGARLPSGELMAVIVFSRVPVSREKAEMFRPLALNIAMAVLPFAGGAVFTKTNQPSSVSYVQQLLHQMTAMQDLLEVHEQAVLEQADQLQETLCELRRRAEELERSNQELEQFAYVASHDLQEPLRAISGYCQLLQRRYGGQLDEKADQFIEQAVSGTKRMQALINGLLTYSRVSTRANPYEWTETAAAVQKAVTNLRALIEEHHAEVRYGDLPRVFADPTQLLQLMQNLIANAIKYRSEEPPRVEITAEERDSEWLFAVRDNGQGIEAKYAEQIFNIFQRLHARPESSGAGIGLAVCKKIVERHGGWIWAESQPGEGSTFYFTIAKHEPSHE